MIETIVLNDDMCSVSFDGELHASCLLREKLQIPNGKQYNIIIPEKINNAEITKIGDSVFYRCINIVSVQFPETLLSIGDEAFDTNSGLESIKFPNNLLSIGECAFHNCENLKEIMFSNSIGTINRSAFKYCKSITKIKLPNNLHDLSEAVFSECTALKEIKLPPKLCKIGYLTFADCNKLKNIIIPENVETISPLAFFNCTELSNIELPTSIVACADDAFCNCENLEIAYKGSDNKLKSIFKSCLLNENFQKGHNSIFATEEIEKSISSDIAESDCYNTVNLFASLTPAQQKYAINKLDCAIKDTNDLNKKLLLLTICENIKEQFNVVSNIEIER